MKEDKNVIEGCFEFIRQDAKLHVVAYHGEHILLHHDKPLTC
jgi:hypothetical protein